MRQIFLVQNVPLIARNNSSLFISAQTSERRSIRPSSNCLRFAILKTTHRSSTCWKSGDREGPKEEVSPPFFEYSLNSFLSCENESFRDARITFSTLESDTGDTVFVVNRGVGGCGRQRTRSQESA